MILCHIVEETLHVTCKGSLHDTSARIVERAPACDV